MNLGLLKLTADNFKILLIAIIIIVSDDTLWFGTNQNEIFTIIKYGVLISLMFFLGINEIRKISFTKFQFSNVICCVLCSLVMCTCIANLDFKGGYFYKCIIIVLSLLIARRMNIMEFAKVFDKIIYFFAYVSVFCMIIAEFNLSLFSVFPLFYNSAYTPFYNLGIYMVPESSGLLRNYGIFREPGVYQMFLVLGIIFHMYFADKVSLKRMVVYTLAIILTFSTTGYIALALSILLYLLKNNNSFKEKKTKYIMLFILALGTIYMVSQTTLLSSDGMIFDKFSNMKRTTMIARSSSFFSNIMIWRENPIIGAGLTKVEELFPLLTLKFYGKYVTHNTNTLLCELATYGIIYTNILVCGYIKFSESLSKNILERVLFLAILLILSCGEKLTFSPIVFILFFYGMIYQKERSKCNIIK